MNSPAHHFHHRLPLGGGLFLLILLLLLEVERRYALPSVLMRNGGNVLLWLSVDTVLIFGALLVLFALSRMSTHHLVLKSFSIITCCLLILTYIAVISSQVYLFKTGTVVDLTLLKYGIDNADDLYSVLASEADAVVAAHIGVALALFCLGIWVAFRPAKSAKMTLAIYGIFIVALGGFGINKLMASDKSSAYQGVIHSLMNFQSLKMKEILNSLTPTLKKPIYEAPVLISEPETTPNIVLIALESMGYDAFMESLGKHENDFPFLSRVASEGRSYHNMYTTVSHTSKALTGLLCGMFPHSNMKISEAEPGGMPLSCLPELLNQVGYTTAFMQTAPGTFENRPQLLSNMGFQTGITGEDHDKTAYEEFGYFGLDDAALVPAAEQWVNAQTNPFFMTLLTIGTHHPYKTPSHDHKTYNSEATSRAEAYQRAVRYSHQVTELLLNSLDSLGALDNTVVIIVGDHGEAFWQHQLYSHDAVPYEEGIKVPLLMWSKTNLFEAANDNTLRQHIDVLPTILELTGLNWKGTLPGKSLLNPQGHDQLYTACWYSFSCYTLRDGNTKYIYDAFLDKFEVYDMLSDPKELNDLSDQYSRSQLEENALSLFMTRAAIDQFYQSQITNIEPAEQPKHD